MSHIDFKVTSSVFHSVKELNTQVSDSLVAMVTDVWCHLAYNSTGAWHTVYAMLLSNNKRDAI